MLARKIARGDLDGVDEVTKGKLNIDEQRGAKAAEREIKNNAMLEQWQKKADNAQGVPKSASAVSDGPNK